MQLAGTLVQDVRYAVRSLKKNAGFTGAALLILALGIGFNTSIFSLVDAVVLRSLPGVERPEELVEVQSEEQRSTFSYPSYVGLRESGVFSGLAAWGTRAIGLSGDGTAERVRGGVVSANYFDVLGARPASGRFFAASEEESGDTVAVLSHGAAVRRFGSAPAALSKSLLLNGVPFTVVGVAAPALRGAGFGEGPDLWIPIGAWPRLATGALARLDYHRRSWGWMSVFGRLSPDLGPAKAAAALEIHAKREAREFKETTDTPDTYHLRLAPLAKKAAGSGNPADPVRFFGLLGGAVGVALLIACANLANLLLARGVARRREIAVRQALGASGGRLVRQMLTESLVLALAGGAAGLLVAHASLLLVTRVPLPGEMTLAAFAPALDARVLSFALVLSLATGLVFGLVPALQASRVALLAGLKADGPSGSRRAPLRSALVGAQVALCLLLLACAGLFVRSLRNALTADLGFQPKNVALASVHLGLARYDAARAWIFATEAVRRVEAAPGVAAAAWAGLLPLSGDRDTESASLPGAGNERKPVDVTAVGPGYFRTMGIPILAGREFEEKTETPNGVPAIVVNEAAAKRFWPGQDPVGQRLNVYAKERTVVGVSKDSLFLSLNDRSLPLVTLAIQQLGGDGVLSSMTLLVRAKAAPQAALSTVRAEIARLDASLPVFNTRTLDASIADQLLPQRFGASLLGLFAVLTLVLAAVGIYAVVAGSVAGRARELGIRLALGARPGEVRGMILRQTAIPIAIGLAVGLSFAAAAAQLFRKFLYGVPPLDLPTFAMAVAVLALFGLVAADLPARRAGRMDPMLTLRGE